MIPIFPRINRLLRICALIVLVFLVVFWIFTPNKTKESRKETQLQNVDLFKDLHLEQTRSETKIFKKKYQPHTTRINLKMRMFTKR